MAKVAKLKKQPNPTWIKPLAASGAGFLPLSGSDQMEMLKNSDFAVNAFDPPA